MKYNLEPVMVEGKQVYLNLASIKELKDLVEKINAEEIKIKQELDDMLKELL